MTEEIEEFAKLLLQQVRDAAVQSCDRRLRGGDQNPILKRWRESAQDGDLESIAGVLIPDIVDDAMFYLLRAVDQGILPLCYSASNGKHVDLSEEGLGELGGWFMGSPGWRAMFATERFNDYLSDR
jgi:hypothetical protein